MRSRSYWKKGAILLQTLVMSVILSMISVMVLKWVLARYIIVNRVQQSAENTGLGPDFAQSKSLSWAVPANNSTTTAKKTVVFNQAGSVSGITRFVTTVTNVADDNN